MTRIELFKPLDGPAGGWPSGSQAERVYLEAFSLGSQAMISNLRTRVLGLRCGDLILPITVNDAEYGDAYVCLPHTAYALYAKAELELVNVGPWSPLFSLLAGATGVVLRAAQFNQVVHIDNWMLSTNLHGRWCGEGLDETRQVIVNSFPGHVLGVRSLSSWSDELLINRLVSAGWRMLPSRQIYVTDDLDREWSPRRDTRRDLALLSATDYELDDLEVLRPGDSERIAQLYTMLYLDRYSALNPAFTAAFIETTHREKVFVYRGLRAVDGTLAAIVGCFIRGGVLTTPIVGYDTSRPATDGLYRMSSILLAKAAQERGLRLNGSAGAA